MSDTGWIGSGLKPPVVRSWADVEHEPESGPVSSTAAGSPLGQDRKWKAKDAPAPVLLVDMAASHRRNLLAFLRRNVERIEFADALAQLAPFHHDVWDDHLDEVSGFADDLAARDPHAWLEGTPLVRRLVELVALDDAAAAALPDEDY